MTKSLMKYVSCYCIVAVFVMGFVPKVYAGFSPSEVVVLPEVDRSVDLEKIQKALETKMIKGRLEQLGFSADEIQSRLGQLNDQQIHELALQIDELKVGGNGGAVIILLLVAALVVVLVVWLTE